MINILFLCTGNSARSILGEVLMNELGDGRCLARSAGSQPVGRVNPGALRCLRAAGHAVDGLRSKSWDEFSGLDAQAFDIVITVCGNAASEVCPLWQGSPVSVHWGIDDPALSNATDAEIDAAFEAAYWHLKTRIEKMLALPLEELNIGNLQVALTKIHLDVSEASA